MLSRARLSLRQPIALLTRFASSSAPPASVPAEHPTFSPPKLVSTSQRPRLDVYRDVRFEQTAIEFQPAPQSAMEMIAEEPIRVVQGRKAVCDGGTGPLGHPKVFINLDKPGPKACGYSGIRFEQDPHHH
ncbi:hypothetical protein BD410DRAFT_780931 [Rickenella mellea]|uniref:Zinc finger CHCC-type domain-containing protein n=1 Tax=Rickenella mellea TaxID=50990 RepID=A0A4Y7QNI3_9AGAM|nr:hypothetical protein BD410DRAFT_780931 [Rickenella mellea]